MADNIRPDEISSIIKDKIEKFDLKLDVEEVGEVVAFNDNVAIVHGLNKAMLGEMVEFENGVLGLVHSLQETSVGVIIAGESGGIKEGTNVKRLKKLFQTPVGKELIGRVLNAIGEPVDDEGELNTTQYKLVETKAPGIMARQSVCEPLQTGIKSIDALIPIGRGQRELIIGDRQTGKTTIAIDTILNQKDSGVICIYVAIGQKQSTVAQIVNTLENHGAMKYTIVIKATASEAATLQYLAPYVGVTIGEYFRDNKQHALIIYDDLSKHAVAYRELSLILRTPPGREAYPGDIFYIHSRLLERAAKLSDKLGGGSLTALPIVETQAGDISGYIPTNVISITDGQIFLETGLFNSGVRPAVNVGLSVSRVGGAAQTKIIKKIAGTMRLDLAQYRDLQAFAQFASDLDEVSKKSLERGERVVEILKQPPYNPVSVGEQAVILYAVTQGFLDDIEVDLVGKFEREIILFIKAEHPDMLKNMKVLDKNTKDSLDKIIQEFKKQFKI